MKDFLKRVLPSWLLYAIFRFLWNPVRAAYWRQLELGCDLPSGLHVDVQNQSDWEIFKEVLVNGEYDFAIEFVLDRVDRRRRCNVIDLGGNVGYFTFRCADRFLQRYGSDVLMQITVVEGSPFVFTELQRRVLAEPLLRPRVKLLCGLVGNRTGKAYIGGSHIHYGNTISARPTLGASLVSFIDLAELEGEADEIDLFKCDIEGAEFDLIENYPAILAKVHTAVFEFHRYGRDIQRCRDLLRSYGFEHSKILREAPTFSIEFFWRASQPDFTPQKLARE